MRLCLNGPASQLRCRINPGPAGPRINPGPVGPKRASPNQPRSGRPAVGPNQPRSGRPSQLEGAATIRAVAKEMIRIRRASENVDDQMILDKLPRHGIGARAQACAVGPRPPCSSFQKKIAGICFERVRYSVTLLHAEGHGLAAGLQIDCGNCCTAKCKGAPLGLRTLGKFTGGRSDDRSSIRERRRIEVALLAASCVVYME